MKPRILTVCILVVSLILVCVTATSSASDDPPTGHTFSAQPASASPDLSDPISAPIPAPFPAGRTRPAIHVEDAPAAAPQSTGGPDDFGYTWDDSVALNWIDATSGTDTGMSGDSWFQKVGPINLPFAFKYHENTYTSLYIAASGYVGFTADSNWPCSGDVPAPGTPNNVVAPYWACYSLASSGPAGRVYYHTGGTAPDRYFVVEWYGVTWSSETYTFEVILHENGDILFQYQTMGATDAVAAGIAGGGHHCTAGIEDSTGLVGLTYIDQCGSAIANKAVRFARPAPSARVGMTAPYQGRFTYAGETAVFQVPIRNTGEFGPDTYDLTTASAWPIALYKTDGVTPLADTDGDGTADTGVVAQGSSATVFAKVRTPAAVSTGDAVEGANAANILIRSSVDPGKSKTAVLQTAVPAPFAQVYRDDADGAMSLNLVQPAGQMVRKATTNGYYGYDPAVAETAGGNFIYAWYKGRSVGSLWVNEIVYTLLDHAGSVIRAPSKLADLSAATTGVTDRYPALAAAPDGRIGVLWSRYLWNSNSPQFNYNVFFAVLDATGNVLVAPTNITNNTNWGEWNTLNLPKFLFLRIAATSDNRFVLTWRKEYETSSGRVEDIEYAVRDTTGVQVRGVTRLTDGVAGQEHNGINLTTLAGNRALLTWFRGGPNAGIYYAALDSAGNVAKPPTNWGIDGDGIWYDSIDATQLADGRFVFAWVKGLRVRFARLDSALNPLGSWIELNNPAAQTGDRGVSITSAGNRAVLTWMDAAKRRNLYYALVNGDGNVLAPPMIFRTSRGPSPYIETSYEGYGNTTYSWTPPAGVDGVVTFDAAFFNGAPGRDVALGLRLANHSATLATGVRLVAALDSHLSYVRDTSGVAPTVSGNQVTWDLPDLGMLESRSFTLYVRMPSEATLGTHYPVTLTLTSAGPEANPDDNTAHAEVRGMAQTFLPSILKLYSHTHIPKSDALTINLGSYPAVIDPQKSSWVEETAHLQLIYEGLTRLNDRLETVPAAAQSWAYNADGAELTFTLRSGLRYSDGTLLNAKRFAYAILRNIDPTTGGDYAYITDEIVGAVEWRTADVAHLTPEQLARLKAAVEVRPLDAAGNACASYEQTDCVTLRLRFTRPAPYFHTVMSLWVTYPAKEENITAGGTDWWKSPALQIGNGPFILQTLTPSMRAYFVRDPFFLRGQAGYNVEFRYVDSASAFVAYQNNELDIIAPGAADIPGIKADPLLSQQLLEYPGFCTFAVMFHNLKPPFTDQKVRAAFAYALDREAWVRDVLAGAGFPTLTWIPRGFPGYDAEENRWGYDPDKARQSLAQSSYGSAANLPPIVATFSDSPRNRDRWTWLINKWREVLGVNVTFNPVPPEVYTQLIRNFETSPQMYILGWCADYPDPQNWLSVYWKTGGFCQRIGYSNPALDALLDQADATVDPATRLQLYAQAQRMLIGDVPAAFAWNSLNRYLVKPWVTGVKTTPMDNSWAGSMDPLSISFEAPPSH